MHTVVAALTLLSAVLGAESNSCTTEQIEWQVERFFAKNNRQWSACGGKHWLARFNELAPRGERFMFDIGCNKGYESGQFFDLLKPEAGLNPPAMFKVHQESRLPLEGDLCGSCGNCREEVERGHNGTDHNEAVHVYCFEPSTVNFAALAGVYARHAARLEQHSAHWHLVNAAVGNRTGLIHFPRDCGSTMCSLHKKKGQGTLGAAFITSVDDFLEVEGLERVDVLKIDAEGNDPEVLIGASKALEAGRVGVLYFEYHVIGLWGSHTLEQTTQWLDKQGYTCYIEGSPTLTRLTGCWHERLEIHEWTNVVCVHRGHYMYPEMERMSFLQQHPTWSSGSSGGGSRGSRQDIAGSSQHLHHH